MNAREMLPNRRASKTFTFACAGDLLDATATVSFFADDRVAEVFVSNPKSGTHGDHATKEAAIILSLALRYGAPVDVIRSAVLRDHLGPAITPVGAALDMVAGEASS